MFLLRLVRKSTTKKRKSAKLLQFLRFIQFPSKLDPGLPFTTEIHWTFISLFLSFLFSLRFLLFVKIADWVFSQDWTFISKIVIITFANIINWSIFPIYWFILILIRIIKIHSFVIQYNDHTLFLNKEKKDGIENLLDKLISLAISSLTLIRLKLLNSHYDPSF